VAPRDPIPRVRQCRTFAFHYRDPDLPASSHPPSGGLSGLLAVRRRWLAAPDKARGPPAGLLSWTARRVQKSEPGPPITLGNAARAELRLIVWCRASGRAGPRTARRAAWVPTPLSSTGASSSFAPGVAADKSIWSSAEPSVGGTDTVQNRRDHRRHHCGHRADANRGRQRRAERQPLAAASPKEAPVPCGSYRPQKS
jgi:hypothetical protein